MKDSKPPEWKGPWVCAEGVALETFADCRGGLERAGTGIGAPLMCVAHREPLTRVAEMLAPYTVDKAQPKVQEFPGLLQVLLRQREQGAEAGVVGPVRPGGNILAAVRLFFSELEKVGGGHQPDEAVLTLPGRAFEAMELELHTRQEFAPSVRGLEFVLWLPAGPLRVRRKS